MSAQHAENLNRSGPVDGKNSSSDSASQTSPHGVRMENRWCAVLTKPIPFWVIAICVVVLVVFTLVQSGRRRAEMETKWSAEKRQPIESLDSFRKRWFLYDRDTQNALLESSVRLVQISREAGIAHSPVFSEAVSALANIRVLRGEYDVAMPLYDEARKNLTKNLEPEHPDVIQIKNNISLAQELQGLP